MFAATYIVFGFNSIATFCMIIYTQRSAKQKLVPRIISKQSTWTMGDTRLSVFNVLFDLMIRRHSYPMPTFNFVNGNDESSTFFV